MSHSNLRNALCRITIFSGHVDKPYVACIYADFKKWPCRRVKFRGQGPFPTTKHLVSALIQKEDVSPGACKDLLSAAGEMERG